MCFFTWGYYFKTTRSTDPQPLAYNTRACSLITLSISSRATMTSSLSTVYTLFTRWVIKTKPSLPSFHQAHQCTPLNHPPPHFEAIRGNTGWNSEEIKSDITHNLYVIKESERASCHPVSCQTQRTDGHLKVERKLKCFLFLLKASVAAKEHRTEDVTDPRCLICSLTDGHLVWNEPALTLFSPADKELWRADCLQDGVMRRETNRHLSSSLATEWNQESITGTITQVN